MANKKDFSSWVLSSFFFHAPRNTDSAISGGFSFNLALVTMKSLEHIADGLLSVSKCTFIEAGIDP